MHLLAAAHVAQEQGRRLESQQTAHHLPRYPTAQSSDHTHTHTRPWAILACISVSISYLSMSIYGCLYIVSMCVCMYVCVYHGMYVWMYVSMDLCMYLCMFVCIYLSMCARKQTYIHTLISISKSISICYFTWVHSCIRMGACMH